MTTTDRAAWLEERRSGIGGSDVANILGEGYQTPLDVYLSKIGEAEELDGPAIKRGRALEPIARELFREVTGLEVLNGGPMLRDKQIPALIANVDGYAQDATTRIVVEIKAPGLRAFAKMKDHGVPKSYYLQVQHYLSVTGLDRAQFVAFSAEKWELLHFPIERDDELIQNMREMLHAWWEAHVVARKPPERERYEIPTDAIVSSGEVTVIDTPEFRDAARRYFEARELADMADELVDHEKANLIMLMGDHQVVETVGARFLHKPTKGRSSFDQKALAAAEPLDRQKVIAALAGSALPRYVLDGALQLSGLDLSQFTKTGAPSQPFRAYQLKAGLTDG